MPSRCVFKLPKRIFAAPSVNCLGYVVSEQGVTTNLDRVDAILKLARPSTIKDVRSFLGMAGYYARFVPDLARSAAPLHALTHKRQTFLWTAGCEEALDALKGALTSEPIMRLPNWELEYNEDSRPQLNHPFKFTTDWSQTAMGQCSASLTVKVRFILWHMPANCAALLRVDTLLQRDSVVP